MLAIENVIVEFDGKTALDLDRLTIKEGEKVAVLGRSGSGKSTLIHYIYELMRPHAALCSQRQGLVENLSVFHNIFMGGLQRHYWLYNLVNLAYPLQKNRHTITQIARELELDCAINQAVTHLSGGQRQRVALARSLYQYRDVFIGDEPFSALDPSMGRRLLAHVLKQHKTVIMVLHDSNMALEYFDRVIGLHEGNKVFDAYCKDIDSDIFQDLYRQVSPGKIDITPAPFTNAVTR
ncbi:ATP-binding cassette domain-containing protein [Shewanella pneumatophori]|uniref:ATP-binding cassette domain-containing protein n=1 Tax=Shewanella pneumatophori TaxID=314092 RepID=A0A9X1Z7N2_9GAMM|nr:ATP-binding cassette domain-containing protein [Shewanella pneumatophori]MCL1136974.1 ATP-binding cassette domain-containing protein [Shewanella pneumatophori]